MISSFVDKHKLPTYKIKQFNDLYYKKAISNFDELVTWSKLEREALKKELEFCRLEPVTKQVSNKQDTIKVLFKLHREPKKKIETVLMRHQDGRNTVCVSCMVGCPVNCSFCATGKMGFLGNLTADEIIDQVMYFQRLLKSENQHVSNVVFMGMGEPMLNLKEVEEAIRVLNDPNKLNISQRRITVSTSGYVRQFEKYIADGFRTKVAVSLHASNQELREKLMPVARQHKLTELFKSLDNYVKLTNKRISYEYVMLDNVNDSKENARELVYLLKNRLAHVNLIPYNTIRESTFKTSSKNRIHNFARILKNEGIECTIRVTMGEDIDAACGQLADRENESYESKLSRLKVLLDKAN